MRDFLKKAALFALLELAIAVLVAVLYDVDENAYDASFIDKHNLLERTSGRRLLLVGGSNVSFSTDSTLLRQELGIQPVDLAIQHALGLPFMLREAQSGMRSGDVIVVSPEYGQYEGRTEEPLLILSVIEQDRRAFSAVDLDWQLFKNMGDRSHLWLRGLLRSAVNRPLGTGPVATRPYTRDSFNAYGDVVAHWSMPAPGFVLNPQAALEIDPAVIEKLNHFAEECKRRGVTVLLFHPAIPKIKFTTMKLGPLQLGLDRTLSIRQLNRIDEMVYPDELFFDTVYHLTRAGVLRRTALLATRLREHWAAAPAVAR